MVKIKIILLSFIAILLMISSVPSESKEIESKQALDSYSFDESYIPEFSARGTDWSRTYRTYTERGGVYYVDDEFVEANLSKSGNIWTLNIKSKKPIINVNFPWQQERRPLDDDISDDIYYFPSGLGTTAKAISINNDWSWRGLPYPGGFFSPLIVIADSDNGRIEAATNWPPKKVWCLAAAERMYFRYEENIPVGEVKTYSVLIEDVIATNDKEPWHVALDLYKEWLNNKMGKVEYPDWMYEGHGIVTKNLQDRRNVTGVNLTKDFLWNIGKKDYNWISFWGQMEPHLGGCCICNQTIHPRYLPELTDFVDEVVSEGYHVSYYSAPNWQKYYQSSERDKWLLDTPQGEKWLLDWIKQNRDYGANAFYIDTLGNVDWGDINHVREMFYNGKIPRETFIEFAMDVYPSQYLLGGTLTQSSTSCGAPHKTPQNSNTSTFVRFGRYLLDDRLIIIGNIGSFFWGERPTLWTPTWELNGSFQTACKYKEWCEVNGPCDHWSERENFLLGAKVDINAGSLSGYDNNHMPLIIEERNRVKWWERRPVYYDTVGLDLSGIPESSRIEVRRFVDKDGHDLFAVSNEMLVEGHKFKYEGKEYDVPKKLYHVIDTKNFCGNGICDNGEEGVSCPQDCSNLVKNPGFEEGVDSKLIPLLWEAYFTGGTGNFELDSKEKHSGSYSWKFTQTSPEGYRGAYSDFIEINANTSYSISAWIKSQDGSQKITMGVEEFSADKKPFGNPVATYFILNNFLGPEWKEYRATYIPIKSDAKYIRFRFFGPYASLGSVWWDDFEFMEMKSYSQKTIGCRNDENSKCLDIGGDESAGAYTVSSAGQIKTDNGISYREILPRKKMVVEFPSFNVDSDGYPLSPMLLEIRYKDKIDEKFYENSSATKHKISIDSYINYIYSSDPAYKLNDKEYYTFSSIGGVGDNQWKVMQYAFKKSPFPLLRAVNNKFTISLTMPYQGIEDDSLYVPIDYISLHKISEEEYDYFYELAKFRMGFSEGELEKDNSGEIYSDLVAYSRDPMRPVYRWTVPERGEIVGTIKTFSALGEIEPIRISLYSPVSEEGITFSFEDLVGNDEIIPKNSIRAERVVYEEKRLDSYHPPSYTYGLIADRIEPLSSLSLDNSSESVWLKVFIPQGLKGGVYSGNVNIKQGGKLVKSVKIEIDVIPMNLEPSEHINIVYMWPYQRTYSDNISEVFRVYREAQLEPFLTISFPSSLDMTPIISGGKIIDFNTTILEMKLDKAIEEGHLKRAAFVSLNSLQGSVLGFTLGSITDKRYIWYNLSDARFVDAFGLAIRKLIEVAKSRNIQFFFSVLDEPGMDPYRRIVVDRIFTIVKNNGGNTTITYYTTCENEISSESYATPNGRIPPLTYLVDYKMWSQNYIEIGYKRNYPNFGYYTTHTAYLRNPVYNRFENGFFAVATEAKAVSVYSMGDLIGDPFNDFDQSWSFNDRFTYPDFLLAYPTNTGKMYETMALEGIREGIKDAKYIATLERLIKENPDSETSKNAQNYIDDIKGRIQKDSYLFLYNRLNMKMWNSKGYYGLILGDISNSGDSDDWEAFTTIRRNIFDHIRILAFCGNDVCDQWESNSGCPQDCVSGNEKSQGTETQGSNEGKNTIQNTLPGSGGVSTGSCNSGETNPCGSSIGECKHGTQSCVNGQWGSCTGQVGPSEEICDGLDNDCNGQIDENCFCVEGQNKPCGSNIGICKQGTQSCMGGQWGACQGNTPPLTEDTCFNYLDDNCNGEVDEECAEAFNTCNNGKLDAGEQGIDCGGKCPKKCPDLEMISVLMVLVGLFGMIGTTVYFGYIK